MVVMAKEVMGGAFKSLSQAVGHEVVYSAGIEMGKVAASAVPVLLEHLGIELTVDLLRARLMDFQVFGWAEVRGVVLDDSLHGVVDLFGTFESAPCREWRARPPVISSAASLPESSRPPPIAASRRWSNSARVRTTPSAASPSSRRNRELSPALSTTMAPLSVHQKGVGSG
jgi:hypothetical protein